MNQDIKVFKFGGASVKDASSIENVVEILKNHQNNKILIVVSAMGKTTNKLEKVVALRHNPEESMAKLQEIKEAHFSVVESLFGEDKNLLSVLNDLFVEVEWAIEEQHEGYDFTYDQVVGVGELASTRLFWYALNKDGIKTEWVDARDIVKTDDVYRESWVLWDKTLANIKQKVEPKFDSFQFVVTQGFIGSTTENNTTTLGREGSDYTGAIFSFGLDAKEMAIWKDVPGVLTGDPKKFNNVVKLGKLSYREAIEMTYYGAKVIHPKTIKPLQNKNIPLQVRSFLNPEEEGTIVTADVENHYPPIVSIQEDQTIVHISTKDYSFVAEHHMGILFQELDRLRLKVNMMQNTAISFALCVTDKEDRTQEFCQRIEENFKTSREKNLELITVRHYQKPLIESLKKGKIILLEQRIRETVQFVAKDFPLMERL